MPKRRDDRLLLEDILESLESIREFVLNMDFDDFNNDKKTRDAVTRNLEIVGEATRVLSATTKAQMATVPWHKIQGFRNRIIHEYFSVSYKIVWLIIQHELEPLETAIRNFNTVS